MDECPKFWSERSQNFKAQFWYSPTYATPDLFAKCSKQCNTRNNWIGNNVPSNDEGYAGLILKQDQKDYSEYLQTHLTAPLSKQELYKVKMKIYWPEHSRFGPVYPGVLLSSIPIDSKKESHIYSTNSVKPELSLDTVVKNKWIQLEFIYRAHGGEEYLTIGCFDLNGVLVDTKKGDFNFCYYFIDDVSLERFEYNYAKNSGSSRPNVISSFEYLDDVTTNHQPENCTCWNCMILSGKVDEQVTTLEEITDFTLEQGQRIDLNRVIFDHQTGKMLPESDGELKRLLFILMEQPQAELRFVIYTYPGNESANEIAKQSAITIYNFLKARGLENSFSYIHAEKVNLSQKDGVPRDRNIELYVVNN